MNKILCPAGGGSVGNDSIAHISIFQALLHVRFMFLLCHREEVLCASACTVHLVNHLVCSVCNKASLAACQVFCPLGYVPEECN
uniref:Uncharacterized protein n=1 Tax=Triticum urartu TaxID=4572 RepID=A0A8R7TPV1_TRIUA